MTAPIEPRGSARAVALYALAMFGAHLSYAPLLTLLLPRRVIAVAPGAAAATTSLVVFAGAITASLAHIAAGRIGDGWRRRHGNRRAPIALGLVLTVLALVALGLGRSAGALTIGLIAFQASLNLMFAPLTALLVDHFPARAKARVAAVISLAMPLAALGTGLAALAFPRDGAIPFFAVAALVLLTVAPLIALWPFDPAPAPAPDHALPRAEAAGPRRDLALIGGARLLIQCGAMFTGSYFYLFLVHQGARAGLVPGLPVDPVYGRLVVVSTVAVLIATLPVGHWSDRHRRRRAPMVLTALLAALALGLIAGAQGLPVLAGYALFQVALIAYLTLDAACAAEILAHHPRAGEMLGYLNLANTLPSVVVPLAVVAATRGADAAMPWTAGFALVALAAMAAGLLVTRLRQVG